MKLRPNILFCCFGLTLLACEANLPSEIEVVYKQLPEQIDFNFHIRPILADRCFKCHGPDAEARKGDLRLDLENSALEKLNSGAGYALVKGRPHQSVVVERILTTDPEQRMPPPDAKLTLTDQEKALLIKWIEQGAEYKPHWAFIKPEKATLPTVNDVNWPVTNIDYFVLKKLEEQGLQPAPPADRETLIRRLSFDIRGLPPSLEEIDRFLTDKRTDAYEKLVDRLLDSPAYGERMAADWLNLARYADSDGYLDDKHRDFSPWRDWVINAFNRNMPYDQFVSWQLAGDLLPNATREQRLATAFNRLHKKNSEAGIVFEEFRVEYVADRTNTFGKAFLGLSLECARCHDHKYDPISQENYYQLFAFFNSTDEIGHAVYGPDQTPGPALLLSSRYEDRQIDSIKQMIRQSERQLLQIESDPATQAEFRRWSAGHPPTEDDLVTGLEPHLVADHSFDTLFTSPDGMIISPNRVNRHLPARMDEPWLKKGVRGKAFFVNDFNRTFLGRDVGKFERTDEFSLDLWLYPDTLYEDATVFHHCEDLRLGLKGYSLHLYQNRLRFIMAHSWPQNALQVTTTASLPVKSWSNVTITYDGSSRAGGVKIYLNGQQCDLSTDLDQLYKGIIHQPDIHTYGFNGFGFGQRDKMKLFKNGGIDEVRLYNKQLTAMEVAGSRKKNQVSKSLINNLQPEGEALLYSHFLARVDQRTANEKRGLKAAREALNALLNGIPEIMVMGDRPEPRATYVLHRGQYDAPREPVAPGTPAAVLEFDKYPPNRLGLAQWLFDTANPLTARVVVNRIWQQYFGTGLVKTTEDFGRQGDLPTHPELLDWLAANFRESGWDLKGLQKKIVLSATYRQHSATTPALLEMDPENKLLSRGPRFRLSAEMIRDNALAVSGLLVAKLGGASVYPYQPEGLWDELSNKVWRYPYLQQPGEGLYRRSIYTIWKRTAPPPSMLIFDSPDRSSCTVRRTPTSTPLQALVLLNDPQYIEACRELATRVIYQEKETEKRLITVHRLLTGRYPQAKELNDLQELYTIQHRKFSALPGDALSYLSNGEKKWDRQIPPADLAALASVSNAVMNTYEGWMRK